MTNLEELRKEHALKMEAAEIGNIMLKYSEREKAAARRLQAILLLIQGKRPVFFNVTQFKRLGLVREHGKTIDNKTNWILTEKAKRFLNITI